MSLILGAYYLSKLINASGCACLHEARCPLCHSQLLPNQQTIFTRDASRENEISSSIGLTPNSDLRHLHVIKFVCSCHSRVEENTILPTSQDISRVSKVCKRSRIHQLRKTFGHVLCLKRRTPRNPYRAYRDNDSNTNQIMKWVNGMPGTRPDFKLDREEDDLFTSLNTGSFSPSSSPYFNSDRPFEAGSKKIAMRKEPYELQDRFSLYRRGICELQNPCDSPSFTGGQSIDLISPLSPDGLSERAAAFEYVSPTLEGGVPLYQLSNVEEVIKAGQSSAQSLMPHALPDFVGEELRSSPVLEDLKGPGNLEEFVFPMEDVSEEHTALKHFGDVYNEPASNKVSVAMTYPTPNPCREASQSMSSTCHISTDGSSVFDSVNTSSAFGDRQDTRTTIASSVLLPSLLSQGLPYIIKPAEDLTCGLQDSKNRTQQPAQLRVGTGHFGMLDTDPFERIVRPTGEHHQYMESPGSLDLDYCQSTTQADILATREAGFPVSNQQMQRYVKSQQNPQSSVIGDELSLDDGSAITSCDCHNLPSLPILTRTLPDQFGTNVKSHDLLVEILATSFRTIDQAFQRNIEQKYESVRETPEGFHGMMGPVLNVRPELQWALTALTSLFQGMIPSKGDEVLSLLFLATTVIDLLVDAEQKEICLEAFYLDALPWIESISDHEMKSAVNVFVQITWQLRAMNRYCVHGHRWSCALKRYCSKSTFTIAKRAHNAAVESAILELTDFLSKTTPVLACIRFFEGIGHIIC